MSNLTNKAENLYIYAVPLIVTEFTSWGTDPTKIEHFRKFPDHNNKRIVKLNNDTLYSTVHTQLANSPYIIHIPKITDRYYLFPILDAYTNVYESIGTRTPERSFGDYILLYGDQPVPKGYEDFTVIRSKDSLNSILLRVETRGRKDYEFVNSLQDKFVVKPLYEDKIKKYPSGEGIIPSQKVRNLSAEEYFTLFAKLSIKNPIKDESIIRAFEQFGYDRNTGEFSFASLSSEQKSALEQGKIQAFKTLSEYEYPNENKVIKNAWTTTLKGLGSYGENYLTRANVALGGWGANIPEDSVYASTASDIDFKPLTNDNVYNLHINADEYPHASYFWSITLYGEPSKFPVTNSINRIVINSYDLIDNLVEKNQDGSLDIYISKNQPVDEKQKKNWLPAPSDEKNFSLTIRIYTPDKYTLDGNWNPPVITKI